MKKYDTYKDSGIKWIGKIPSHWKNYRIDWITKIVRGNTGFKRDELLKSGEYVALQYGKTYKVDIVDDSFNFFVNEEFFKESQIVSKGDTILISTSETVEDLGHSCYYNKENIGLLGGEQILLKPNRKVLYDKYLYQYSRQFCSELKQYAKGLKVFRFNTTNLKQIFLAIPPIYEQTQIANYLDHKTQQIDSLISKKERFIGLLEEERTAIINQAVTKGLDPTAPMKDSGVDWLGEIPEHWMTTKLKYHTKKIIDGAHFTPTYVDDKSATPFLRVTDLHKKTIDLDNVKRIPVTEHIDLIKRCNPKKGDLLLSKNGTIGLMKIIDWDWEFSIFVSLCLIKFEPSLLNLYFFFFFKSSVVERQIYESSQKTSVTNLHLEKIKELRLTIPSIEEQDEIVAFLKFKNDELDKLKNNIISEIKYLKEYKTTLISEVVTGKLDVREEILN